MLFAFLITALGHLVRAIGFDIKNPAAISILNKAHFWFSQQISHASNDYRIFNHKMKIFSVFYLLVSFFTMLLAAKIISEKVMYVFALDILLASLIFHGKNISNKEFFKSFGKLELIISIGYAIIVLVVCIWFWSLSLQDNSQITLVKFIGAGLVIWSAPLLGAFLSIYLFFLLNKGIHNYVHGRIKKVEALKENQLNHFIRYISLPIWVIGITKGIISAFIYLT